MSYLKTVEGEKKHNAQPKANAEELVRSARRSGTSIAHTIVPLLANAYDSLRILEGS